MNGLFLEQILIWNYEKDEKQGEERKEFKENLIQYLKREIENNLNIYVGKIELIKNSSNFKVITVYNEYIEFNFIRHNNTCKINFNGKYQIVLKMDEKKIDEYFQHKNK